MAGLCVALAGCHSASAREQEPPPYAPVPVSSGPDTTDPVYCPPDGPVDPVPDQAYVCAMVDGNEAWVPDTRPAPRIVRDPVEHCLALAVAGYPRLNGTLVSGIAACTELTAQDRAGVLATLTVFLESGGRGR